jgi:transketolase
MPVTLTDEQIADLRQRLGQAETNRQIAEAAAQVWNHPEKGNEAKALWKSVFPDSAIPEFDLEQRVNQRFEQEKRDRDEREKRDRDREQDDRLAAARKKTQDDFGFTDDAMGRLEKLMVDRNIGDYEVAASYMASKEPKVTDGDAGYSDGFWNHQAVEGFEEISKDPEAWGRREILKTLRETDQRNRGGWR